MITRVSGVIRAEGSDLIFDHPYNGYARASYASGGGGASRMPRIAGDVAAGLRGCASGAGTGEQQREAATVLP